MPGKRSVTNIASVGIIYRKSDPREIFIEVKDDGHPIKLVRRQLCVIGGNWIGDGAKQDRGPLDTFRRELEEELSFDRPLKTGGDLQALGLLAEAEIFAPSPEPTKKVSVDDRTQLKYLKAVISESAVPFGAFTNTITKVAMDTVDPENKRDNFIVLACYWTVPLAEPEWQKLRDLQQRFGNLSNESITLLTSLDEIIATGVKTSFAHDRVLQRFFLAMGFSEAKNLPLVEGLESVFEGPVLASYEDYLEQYEIAKRP